MWELGAVKPKRLELGQRVGLFAPAGPVTEAQAEQACERIARLGFEPVLAPGATARQRYLAGEDEARAAGLNALVADASVRALVALRGGYGTARILERVDLAALRRDPRPIVGFSDVTALHLWLGSWGHVTLHGPMPASSTWSDWSAEQLRRALTDPGPLGELEWPEGYAPDPLVPGRAEGVLVGGNLTLLACSVGTPWEVEAAGKVLLLEDVDEPPYAVDRHLWHLRQAGVLDGVRAVLVGEMVRCEAPDREADYSLREVVRDCLKDLGVPVLAGLPAGHGRERATLPLGVRVAVDSEAGRVTFLEPHLS